MAWIARPDLPSEELWLWRIGFAPVRAVATALLPIAVEGLENLPPRGAYILVSNHISWYDPVALEFALGVPIRFMAKREAFAIPILGFVLLQIGNFPVRRGESDRRAVATALRVLAAGQPLGFFPEGHRSDDGRLQRAKPGVAFLARRSGAPLVPVAVTGTTSKTLGLPARGGIAVRVGAPFALADLGDATGDDRSVADAIMRRVAALLPEPMRGAYGTTA